MLVRAGNFFFHHRNWLFPALLVLALLPGPAMSADPVQALWLGLAVSLAGQSVRCLTIGYDYIIRGGRNRRVYAESLVTGGLYAICRNPMYVGNLPIQWGVALATNSWTCVLVAIPLFTFIYIAIVAAEENFLRGKFGADFDQYCVDVPRWLPRLGGLAEVLRRGHYRWRRTLVKEYGTPFGWWSMMVVLASFNYWRSDQLAAHTHTLQVLWTAWGVLAVFFLVVRQLKRSKVIVAD
ncbi:MAG: hypothetical protein RL026_827 [Pseudomonadota bacterium]|jgi:protein-S-isoprenylcysteine O-methyltransferase Ste14